MRALTGSLAVTCCAALVVAATASAGTAPTRAEYVKRADAICKPVSGRIQRLFERGGRLIERGAEARGANLFIEGWRITKPATRKLRGLARPDGDAKRIERYLDLEMRNANMQIKAWKLFKREKYDRAIKLGRSGSKVHKRAHKAVRGFGFKYCA